MFSNIKTLLVITTVLSFFSPAALAENYSVIVHPSNNAPFDSGTVQRIFLSKEKTFSNGNPAIPIDIKPPSDQRENFREIIIQKSASQIRSYWTMLVFSGKGAPPKEAASEKEVADLVAKKPNMIGYVSSSIVSPDVKVVLTF